MQKLVQLDQVIRNTQITEGSTTYTYSQMCDETQPGVCTVRGSPLEFWRTTSNTYDLSGYTTDAQIVAKINTGKGDASLYPPASQNFISINGMFGGTTPTSVTTTASGTNNLQQAQAIKYLYFLKNDKSAEERYKTFEQKIEDNINSWINGQSDLNAYISTLNAINRAFSTDI